MDMGMLFNRKQHFSSDPNGNPDQSEDEKFMKLMHKTKNN